MSDVASPTRYPRLRRGVVELALVLTLYVLYSGSRLFADDSLAPALVRAQELLHVESLVGLHFEASLNQVFVETKILGLLSSYWYATAHYVVTAVALLWLYRLGARHYVPARRALVAATLIGLALYLLLPTAPPRFVEGYVDVLSLHAADGWWGSDASAPKGLGGLTNQLAAFPSLHAGWALWVAIIVQMNARTSWVRALGWTYALITAVVIVGTGNHWVLDAIAGWLVIGLGFLVAARLGRRLDRRAPADEANDPEVVVSESRQHSSTSVG
ncbi:inositol phosphorylceramide synthase [Nocardioides sp. zg-579]|uniref:Inositol phosphorylceramide synthase n=1 Tax=Nocardioides marmotae TaxID=2663857 RepID=A0A6I3IXY4_9ACTN|nr:phosphatase PAP2 family protein [Nocardioides marmotae]MCR6030333.1 inositol phosphorylceramide synthase [Gordonia jinghuaiqii]MTB93967.1 inositol phosphorylceramide synthase [Nocardioides marmotae]QKE00281.1 phosphatase PAP2 family protein [Nocardioides marmotae]